MILSKTGSLYQQPNLFHFFLSTSSVLEHELKTHISDVLKTVYLLLVQIGCFHIYKNFFQSCNKSHLAVQIWCGKRDTYFSLHSERGCDFETIRLPKDNTPLFPVPLFLIILYQSICKNELIQADKSLTVL